MLVCRFLMCLGLATGCVSIWDTLSHSWDPTFEAPRLKLGPTHTNYHAFREFMLEVGAGVTMLFVIFAPRARRARSLWIVMAVTAGFYYGGWWLPGPLLGLHTPNRIATLVHLVASILSLTAIAMSYAHFVADDRLSHVRRPNDPNALH